SRTTLSQTLIFKKKKSSGFNAANNRPVLLDLNSKQEHTTIRIHQIFALIFRKPSSPLKGTQQNLNDQYVLMNGFCARHKLYKDYQVLLTGAQQLSFQMPSSTP
ncbi:hypothetical protein OTU49_007956, partial [Cherax quadricarinatus]